MAATLPFEVRDLAAFAMDLHRGGATLAARQTATWAGIRAHEMEVDPLACPFTGRTDAAELIEAYADGRIRGRQCPMPAADIHRVTIRPAPAISFAARAAQAD